MKRMIDERTQTTKHDPPAQIGEPIPGTDLVRRWQAGREIAPMYAGDIREPGAETIAMQQADKAGYRSVFACGHLNVKLFGEWCGWYGGGLGE